VGFNVNYLLDALNALHGDDVLICLRDANSSCLLRARTANRLATSSCRCAFDGFGGRRSGVRQPEQRRNAGASGQPSVKLIELRLENWRNIAETRISAGPGINVLEGPNGAGKTSVLEAIYLLSHGRSFRTQRGEFLYARDVAGRRFWASRE
jgi:hypothetical protein